MKILILGASGMIGIAIYNQLVKNDNFQVIGTTSNLQSKIFLENKKQLGSIKIFDFLKEKKIKEFLKSINPEIIINCAGIIKQNPSIDNKINTIFLNSILPNQISMVASKENIKFIHISTDCVFSGKRGSYLETENPDPVDLYGRTKLIGETNNSRDLILRTSLVGHELYTKNGLLEWFLSQDIKCKGFKKAFFSGLTTIAFAKLVEKILLNKLDLKGLYHVSSSVISKFDFLNKVKVIYKKNIEIEEDNKFFIDRSLNGTALEKKINYKPDTWDHMIEQMFEERYLYV